MRKELKLTYEQGRFENGPFDSHHPCVSLCATTLRGYFEIPHGTKTIFAVISSEETPDSYRITNNSEGLMRINVLLSSGHTNMELLYRSVKVYLAKFGFPCWVSIEYEEEKFQ